MQLSLETHLEKRGEEFKSKDKKKLCGKTNLTTAAER